MKYDVDYRHPTIDEEGNITDSSYFEEEDDDSFYGDDEEYIEEREEKNYYETNSEDDDEDEEEKEEEEEEEEDNNMDIWIDDSLDPNNKFFKNISETVSNMPPSVQLDVKAKVKQLITGAELALKLEANGGEDGFPEEFPKIILQNQENILEQ